MLVCFIISESISEGVYYFNSISVSSALVYSANTELDRELLTSPVTSDGLMRD